MFKHTFTGIIFNNRKEAVRVMGQSRYRKALKNHEFEFDYELKDGESVIKTIFSE